MQWVHLLRRELTAVVQRQLVEHPAAGFLSYVLVNNLSSQLLETDPVGERLAAGLEREAVIKIKAF